ncbi:MAG TPA: DUF1080 domain-containing protein [Mariniphaga sp.]|nr:DUF1080 domain-containing protein [Mariniphaga sp.]
MKKNLIVPFILALFLYSCQSGNSWQPLFNGEDLNNWDMHLGSPIKGYEDLAKSATPDKVFSVVEQNGEKLLQITGEVNGSLASRDTFANYHLQLVFKYGDKVYSNRNSGLLYHSFGNFGEALGTWMVNIECQLMHERMGDTYLMNNTYCEAPVVEDDGSFRYDKGGEVKKFSIEHNGQLVKKAADYENPIGEWNTVDVYTVGRTAVHVVNGHVTVVNKNTGVVENGNVLPLESGKIQLQSEGSELFIRTIQIRPIKEIPAELLN